MNEGELGARERMAHDYMLRVHDCVHVLSNVNYECTRHDSKSPASAFPVWPGDYWRFREKSRKRQDLTVDQRHIAQGATNGEFQ